MPRTKNPPTVQSRTASAANRVVALFSEIDASKTTSETLAATTGVMELADKMGELAQAVAGNQYAKLVKSGRWWLGGIDMKWEARQQRKLYDQTGAYFYAAADSLAAVVARQEQLLAAANRKSGNTYKPGE